ncbi:MAG: DUF4336 domain-containing protein [Myxococcales bacterium]|nr:DUF4336 domain-containing protein [Myxococcales bacterium]
MAREIGDEIWVFDRPLSVIGLKIGTRMTVIRLEDGSLFLHSPVEIDKETRAELEELGTVRYVVAPNKFHHLFIGAYRAVYPEARLIAAPGLPEKRKDIAFDEELGPEPPAVWAGQIDQELFGGAPYVNETLFYHRKSKTLLATDMLMNHVENDSLITRLWLRTMGLHKGFASSRLMKTLTRDREAARASRDRILAWDVERVTVTHGVVLQRSGNRMLRQALSWLD